MLRVLPIITLFFTTSFLALGQDTLWLPGKNLVVGEVKEMKQGVLSIETAYSDSDFKVEWINIDSIRTFTRFLISVSGNRRYTGKIKSKGPNGRAAISKLTGADIPINLIEVVSMESLKEDFWQRVEASIDFGLQITRANNLMQFNSNSILGYRADRWQINGTYSALSSTQDNTTDINRRDYGFTLIYFPQKKWYTYGNLTWFSNTEQAIDLRFTAKIGLGRGLIENNRVAWSLLTGIAPINERFSNGTNENQSTESFVATRWNLFDTGDLSFSGESFNYFGITEQGRFRSDLTANLKYDLPLDFYIKGSLTLNYDNQPAVVGNETDYVWSIGFGWELDR